MNLPPPTTSTWPPVAAAKLPATPRPMMILALGGAVVAGLGTVLPWVSVRSAFLSVDVAGVEGDGKIALGVAAIIALLAVLALTGSRIPPVQLGAVGLVGLAVVAYDWHNIANSVPTGGSPGITMDVSVGVGLYVCAVGFLAVVIGAWMQHLDNSRTRTQGTD